MNPPPTAAARVANRMHALARTPRRRNLRAPTTLLPALRRRIENGIEALILLLDAADPDPDLEPSFGYLPNGAAADECEGDQDQDLSEERHHA